MKTKPRTKPPAAKPRPKAATQLFDELQTTHPPDPSAVEQILEANARRLGYPSFTEWLSTVVDSATNAACAPKTPPASTVFQPDTPVRILRPDEPLQPGDVTHTLRNGTVPVEPACAGMRAQMYPGLCMRPVKTPRWVPFAERMPGETDYVKFGTDSPREIVVCHASAGIAFRTYPNRDAPLHDGSPTYWLEGLEPPPQTDDAFETWYAELKSSTCVDKPTARRLYAAART